MFGWDSVDLTSVLGYTDSPAVTTLRVLVLKLRNQLTPLYPFKGNPA
jgi:hypothetical protein